MLLLNLHDHLHNFIRTDSMELFAYLKAFQNRPYVFSLVLAADQLFLQQVLVKASEKITINPCFGNFSLMDIQTDLHCPALKMAGFNKAALGIFSVNALFGLELFFPKLSAPFYVFLCQGIDLPSLSHQAPYHKVLEFLAAYRLL